jgi:hypothetical protein
MKSPEPDKPKAEGESTVNSQVPGGPAPAGQLTPEEQMDLYEKELKENDWGHQPC